MQERLGRAVDALLRPKQPEPAEYVRVLLVHGGTPPAYNLEGDAQIVAQVVGVPNDKFLDVPGTPLFDLLISETDALCVDTTLRYLSVRRPPVFVLLGQDINQSRQETVKAKAERMGYEVRSGKLSDGAEVVAGTLIGVAPRWESLVLLEFDDPLAFDSQGIINEAVKLAKWTGE
ncbi:MAG: hypothetical protein OXE17_01500 [Chloroflexi bacterium]|nr:hypothetical protein [Chloroflexota bacterium]